MAKYRFGYMKRNLWGGKNLLKVSFTKSKKEYKEFINMWNGLLTQEKIGKEEIKLVSEAEHLITVILLDINRLKQPTDRLLAELEKKKNLFTKYDQDKKKKSLDMSRAQYGFVSDMKQLVKKEGNLKKLDKRGYAFARYIQKNVGRLDQILKKLDEKEGTAKKLARKLKERWQEINKINQEELAAIKQIWGADVKLQ